MSNGDNLEVILAFVVHALDQEDHGSRGIPPAPHDRLLATLGCRYTHARYMPFRVSAFKNGVTYCMASRASSCQAMRSEMGLNILGNTYLETVRQPPSE